MYHLNILILRGVFIFFCKGLPILLSLELILSFRFFFSEQKDKNDTFALFILLHYQACYVDNSFICNLAYQLDNFIDSLSKLQLATLIFVYDFCL